MYYLLVILLMTVRLNIFSKQTPVIENDILCVQEVVTHFIYLCPGSSDPPEKI